MSNATFHYTCKSCNKSSELSTPWIDPVLFTKPEAAKKTITWWCTNCGDGQAVLLKLLPDNNVELLETLEYKELSAEIFDSPQAPINLPNFQRTNRDVIDDILGTLDLEEI